MRRRNFISIVLCLILFINIFAVLGCDNNKNNDDASVCKDYYSVEFYAEFDKVDIGTNGVSNYVLVVPENPSEILKHACKEINYFLFESAGLTLTVLQDNQDVPDDFGVISLGKTKLFNEKNFDDIDYSTLKEDGFIVRCTDKDFYIDSNSDRGVLYGSYELLKRYVGVRFLTQDFTHIPKLSKVEFAIYNFDFVPEFQHRFFLGYDRNTDYFTRSTMYGEISSGSVVGTPWSYELGNIHTVYNYYVKADDYKEEHPEFFASYTNKAAALGLDDPCYSNGITDEGKLDETMEISVAKATIKTIVEYLKLNPTKKFFMLGINDQYDNYCLCDTCKARATMLGQSVGNYSGITTMYCNVVVNEVNEWIKNEGENYGVNEEIVVIQFAYNWTLDPPVHQENGKWVANHELAIPNDNVYVKYAPLSANYAYSLGSDKQMSKYLDVVDGWSSICENLMLYDYTETIRLYTSYQSYLSYISEQAKYLKNNNFYSWMTESVYTTDGIWNLDLIRYVMQRLWWDVDYDVSSAVNEFIELYNGEAAAPYVKEFVKLNEERYAILASQKSFWVNPVSVGVVANAENYPIAFLEKCESLLEEAKHAILNDNSIDDELKAMYLKNIAEVMLIPQTSILYNYDSYYMDGKEEYKQKFRDTAAMTNISLVTSALNIEQFLENV